MTYAEYQILCAHYGFTETPLTEAEFNRVFAAVGVDEVYEVGCDVAAGFDLDMLIGKPVTA